METIWKKIIPLILIAVLVFLGVLTAFIWNGVQRSEQEMEALAQEQEQTRANILLTLAQEDGSLCGVLVCSLDPKKQTIDMISIPADTLTDVAGSNQELGAVPSIGGIQMVLEKMPSILPLPITGYLAFQPDSFVQAVDLTGGVQFDVPYSISQRAPGARTSTTVLRRGSQTLDGAGAWAMMQYSGEGAAAQQELQREFFKCYVEQLAALDVQQLESIIRQTIAQVTTDFSSYSTAEYAQKLAAFNPANSQTAALPGSYQSIDGHRFFCYDVTEVNAFVNQMLNR